jgi:hypothetical protein
VLGVPQGTLALGTMPSDSGDGGPVLVLAVPKRRQGAGGAQTPQLAPPAPASAPPPAITVAPLSGFVPASLCTPLLSAQSSALPGVPVPGGMPGGVLAPLGLQRPVARQPLLAPLQRQASSADGPSSAPSADGEGVAASASDAVAAGGGGLKRKKKDPNAPKQPLSSYQVRLRHL